MPLIKFFMNHSLSFYFVAAIVVAAFLVVTSGLLNQYRLANDAKLITGLVVQPQCDRHLSFIYQFVVNEVPYHGMATSGECNQIKSGDPVQIYYLAENPKISMGESPKNALTNNVMVILIGSLTVPLVLLLSFWIKLRKWRKASNAMTH